MEEGEGEGEGKGEGDREGEEGVGEEQERERGREGEGVGERVRVVVKWEMNSTEVLNPRRVYNACMSGSLKCTCMHVPCVFTTQVPLLFFPSSSLSSCASA